MRNGLIVVVFSLGFGLFFYPIISDFYATKEHHSVVSEYENMMESLEKEQIEAERKKAEAHNKELKNSPIHYVDPFSESVEETNEGNSYYNALNIGPAIGSIEIPKINVELPIYHGTSEETLSQGVGHLENSSLPTGKPGTHSVLTAHRGLPSAKLFRNLDALTIGDQFFIQTLDETYAYQVYNIEVVLPDQTDWLEIDQEGDFVTLLTCEPYMINTHRMLVMGKRISDTEINEVLVEDTVTKNSTIHLYIVPALFILLTVYLLYRKKRKGSQEDET